MKAQGFAGRRMRKCFLKKYNRNIDETEQKCTYEVAIHDFRVEVKKLRAFLRLQNSAAGMEEDVSLPKKLKKDYSLFGKIRDHQLCIKKITEFEKEKNTRLKKTVAVIKKAIKGLKKKKLSLATKDEFKKAEKIVLQFLPKTKSSGHEKKFFEQKTAAAHKIISRKSFTNERLHSIRKNIKDLIYISWTQRHHYKKLAPVWNRTKLKTAENIARLLGLHNDLCIATALIKKISDGEDKKNLHLLFRKWQIEKRSLRAAIIPELSMLPQ
jgi:CHAD domain-containing protein